LHPVNIRGQRKLKFTFLQRVCLTVRASQFIYRDGHFLCLISLISFVLFLCLGSTVFFRGILIQVSTMNMPIKF
jgi:hypothetical protein